MRMYISQARGEQRVKKEKFVLIQQRAGIYMGRPAGPGIGLSFGRPRVFRQARIALSKLDVT